ncbi:MAG: phosphoenolpyruvate--protein phosphotransferase [Planctomycetes bacterium]|nr:phosphoenolpyruvate--protein phosphotransferase [Planctomycetota bacterium]
MDILKGIPVSPGFAIGEAFVLGSEETTISRRFISSDEVETECARFRAAVEKATKDINVLQDAVKRETEWKEVVPIFEAHAMMLADKSLHDEVVNRITNNRFSAEYAVSRSLRKYEKNFNKMDNPYLKQRISDIRDIEQRLLQAILGERREDFYQLDREVILIAHDMSPSEAALMDREHIIGFATDVGGRTGHTAIIARAREIPAVVGLETLTEFCSGGEKIIIDGGRGIVIINPDSQMLESYRRRVNDFRNFETTLIQEKDLPAETQDGVMVKLSMNIEFPNEMEAVREYGGDGVGLYRTEYLYLSSKKVPEENDHFQAYKQALVNLDGGELTVRTFDLGADKFFHLEKNLNVSDKSLLQERNPALGCRAIRYTSRHPQLMRAQVRAACRASAFGDLRIMLPMVCCREEVTKFRELVQREQEALDEVGEKFNPMMPIGIMVEVPSVALNLENFVDICEFFSIGTNDLTQYTMAVDRGNEHIAELYRPANIGVLRLIKQAIDVANDNGRPVSVCGEMAGDPTFTFLLLGMGLRHFSVCPPLLPEIKKLVRSISISDAEEIMRDAMRLKTSNEITSFLRSSIRKYQPNWSFA